MTKRGKQASRKAAARKYGFLEVPSCGYIVFLESLLKANSRGHYYFALIQIRHFLFPKKFLSYHSIVLITSSPTGHY
ncbi:MAG: hypothetical protein Q8K59_04495 [Nitrosomonas sp.]|nr:hypothetical protein [Nitrosomonas sp.]MDP1950348.1 hypothetical protein [Nitrosomonas sp.]